jgi:hypothetical protein
MKARSRVGENQSDQRRHKVAAGGSRRHPSSNEILTKAGSGGESKLRVPACITGACLLVLASIEPHVARAASVQTTRLVAIEVPLNASPTHNVYAEIWKDKLPEIAATRAAVSGNARIKPSTNAFVYSARFKDGASEIVFSALATNECVSYESLAQPPSVQSCPARVVVVLDGVVKIVAVVPSFTFAIPITGHNEADNTSTRDNTKVTFDPESHSLSAALTADGKLAKSSPSIHFDY